MKYTLLIFSLIEEVTSDPEECFSVLDCGQCDGDRHPSYNYIETSDLCLDVCVVALVPATTKHLHLGRKGPEEPPSPEHLSTEEDATSDHSAFFNSFLDFVTDDFYHYIPANSTYKHFCHYTKQIN